MGESMNDLFIDFIIDKMITPLLQELEEGEEDDGQLLLQKDNDRRTDGKTSIRA